MVKNKIVRTFQILGSAAFIFVMAIIVVNILTRSIFDYVIPGVYDIITTVVTVFGSCALIVTTYEKGHIIVDIMISHLPELPKWICKIVAEIIDLGYYMLLCYGGYIFGVSKLLSRETRDSLPIPVAPFRLFWALCAAIICCLTIVRIAGALKRDTVNLEQSAEEIVVKEEIEEIKKIEGGGKE